MSDTAVADPALEASDESFTYPIEVSDAGPAAKKVSVTVPRDRIDAKMKDIFGDVRQNASLPGFRPGKAPRHLVEKKFGKAVKDQVQGDLLRESYQQAIEKNQLSVLGDPDFEDAQNIKLPDEGDFTYSFTVEVRPDVTLPSMEHLTVKKPKITINDDHVDQALDNLRNQQGALMPVEDRATEAGDYLVADVSVKHGDEEIASQEDAQLIARGGTIAGIKLDDFADKVKGMKPGDDRTISVQAPAEHPNAKIAGKDVQIHVKLKDLKRLEPAVIDEPFLESLGFENQDELMQALREQMEERVEQDVQNAMRRQVSDYLVKNTEMQLPEKMSARQTDRVVNRRAMDLLQRGVPQEKVRDAIEQLRQGADETAKKELKTFFILDKAADENSVQVDEQEINGQIAMLALDRGERPEALRDRMMKDGSLQNLVLATRERKTLDVLIEQAKVEEVEPTAEQTQEAVDQATGGGGAAEAGETEDVT